MMHIQLGGLNKRHCCLYLI
nr:unnamed protein product [Callosobruchus chinensis]